MKKNVLAALVFFAIGFGFQALKKHYHQAVYRVVVDAMIEKGTRLDLQAYGTVPWLHSVPLHPGKRELYHFDSVPMDVTYFRLDLSNQAENHGKIYQVRLERGNSVVEIFSAKEIREWELSGGEVEASTGDSLAFYNKAPHAILTGPLIDHGVGFKYLFLWTVLLFMFFLLLCQFRQLGRLYQPWLWIVPVLGLMSWWLIHFVYQWKGGYFPVNDSIGLTNYFSYPKRLDFYAFALVAGFSGLLGALAGWWRRRPENEEPVFGGITLEKRDWCIFGLATLWFVWFNFPPLADLFDSARHASRFLNFDARNAYAWKYFSFKGEIPYRDFWYPYSGHFNESYDLPLDHLRIFSREWVLFSGLFFSAYLLLRKNWIRTFYVLSFVGILMPFGIILAPYRYFLCLLPALWFVAQQRLRHQGFSSVLLGIFSLYAFIYEPNQCVYGLLAQFGVLVCYWAAPGLGQSRRRLLHSLLIQGGVFLAGGLLYFVSLKSHGQWDGFVDFLQSSNSMLIYGALPLNFREYFASPWTREKFLFWGTLGSLVYGFFIWFSRRRGSSDVLVLSALLTVVVFPKVILAWPGVTPQVTGYLFLGWAIFFFEVSFSLDRFVQWSVGALVAFFLVIFVNDTNFPLVPKLSLEKFKHVKLSHLISEEYETLVSPFFSPKSFLLAKGNGQDLLEEIETYFHHVVPSYYVLGDDSYLYIFLNQKHPRYVSIYNEAPVGAQHEVLEWLEKEKPEIVFWDSSFKTHANIPNPVRVPLIYQYVIDHYRPEGKIGQFEVLRRQAQGKSIPLSFWKAALGSEVDLGYVPARSVQSGWKDCKEGSVFSSCVDFVDLEEISHSNEKEARLLIQSGRGLFSVRFDRFESPSRYRIPLHRLWFYSAAIQGQPYQFTCPGGFRCKIARILDQSQILY